MEKKIDDRTCQYAADIFSIKEARERITAVIQKTPVLSLETFEFYGR